MEGTVNINGIPLEEWFTLTSYKSQCDAYKERVDELKVTVYEREKELKTAIDEINRYRDLYHAAQLQNVQLEAELKTLRKGGE